MTFDRGWKNFAWNDSGPGGGIGGDGREGVSYVWGLGLGVRGLEFGVQSSGFQVQDFGFGV